MNIYIYVCVCVCIDIYIYIYYACICIYEYVYMYVYNMYIYTYVYVIMCFDGKSSFIDVYTVYHTYPHVNPCAYPQPIDWLKWIALLMVL